MTALNETPKPKKNKSNEPDEEEVSFRDVYSLEKDMKSEMEVRYGAITAKIDSLEKKLAAVETALTEKIKEEATRTKALIEEELKYGIPDPRGLEEHFKRKISRGSQQSRTIHT